MQESNNSTRLLYESPPGSLSMFNDFLELDSSTEFIDSHHPTTESRDIFSSQELDNLFASLTKAAAGCGTSDCCVDDLQEREFQDDDGICALLSDINKREEMENLDKLADTFDSIAIV
ncbi:3369_t:CDS:1 [Ambispora leptoticha]|uniref:3369_t:CDS:1 n=1 Tax=Ambispora leptoticha TaxID=144679 RepID=A0A9N8ZHZ6_9GLOM|nr:3369_t:CDS:1 [Ambispora leptoticha]